MTDYFAFIIYKDDCEDKEWAQALHKKLEHYKFPIAIPEVDPTLIERIGSICEYKPEAASGFLLGTIWNSLVSSKFLIVVCSPHSAKSQWINDAIRFFIETGRERNIIPVIIEGKAKSAVSKKEYSPKALLELEEDREIRGIIINENNFDAAAVEVVAYMFGLKYDALWHGYERDMEIEKQRIIETNNHISRNLARFVAEKASKLVDEGDSYLARRLLLEVVSSPIPYTMEVESAFRIASMFQTAILKGHTGSICFASFSPNGKRIVSASFDNSFRIWDSETGRQIAFVQLTDRPHGIIHSASFSPDGKYIVSASSDNIVRIWDAETGLQIGKTFEGHKDDVYSTVFSPDGKRIVSSSMDHTIRIYLGNGSTLNSTNSVVFGGTPEHPTVSVGGAPNRSRSNRSLKMVSRNGQPQEYIGKLYCPRK